MNTIYLIADIALVIWVAGFVWLTYLKQKARRIARPIPPFDSGISRTQYTKRVMDVWKYILFHENHIPFINISYNPDDEKMMISNIPEMDEEAIVDVLEKALDQAKKNAENTKSQEKHN